MPRYDDQTLQRIKLLRSKGFTYSEIQVAVGKVVPKSSLSYICRDVALSKAHKTRINSIMLEEIAENRRRAILVNRQNFEAKLKEYHKRNLKLKNLLKSRDAKLISLAILYLGEGSKHTSHRGLMLGSANPNILKLYINLLNECYDIEVDSLRCRVQQRADQNPRKLVKYWSQVTGVKVKHFYPSYVDKRTIGKPTQKPEYRGVCVITCAGTHIQLELQVIADIIVNEVGGISSVG